MGLERWVLCLYGFRGCGLRPEDFDLRISGVKAVCILRYAARNQMQNLKYYQPRGLLKKDCPSTIEL